MKDVARAAGVSTATVSYVLNDKSAGVSDETRQRVLNAVQRLGYIRNSTAQNLRTQRTRLIGFAWGEKRRDTPNAVLDIFAYHLTRTAAEIGYRVLTFTYPENDPIPVYRELIRTQRVDAFVVANTVYDDPRIRFLIDQEFPFVTFGRANPEWDFNWVDTDGQSGVNAAVTHLIAQGHQRIALLAWPEDSLSGNFRVLGYRQALAAAGVPFDPLLLLRGEGIVEFGRSALRQLWALPVAQRPTAIVAVSDLIAVGVMHEARDRGIDVGAALAVVGFDDEPMSAYLSPSLTTLAQPLEAIASAMVVILDELLNQGRDQRVQQLITPHLIVRESIGKR